jgi:hypothetical protein
LAKSEWEKTHKSKIYPGISRNRFDNELWECYIRSDLFGHDDDRRAKTTWTCIGREFDSEFEAYEAQCRIMRDLGLPIQRVGSRFLAKANAEALDKELDGLYNSIVGNI